MRDIKPIETYYNGYRFRSRLEARWAVFFDYLNIKYQYEPEGFKLHDGTYYLPDFYLDDFDLYVEIKPFDRSVVHHVGDNNKWERKCANFRDSTDRAILLCYGAPADDLYKYLFAFDTCDSSAGTSEYDALFTVYSGRIVLCTCPTRTDRDVYTRGFSSGLKTNENVGTPAMFTGDIESLWDDAVVQYDPNGENWLDMAKTKARQARFEHGETPNILF